MKFSLKYLIISIIILLIEIFIGIFVHDNIIRPYIGDILIIPFLYAFIRIFVNSDTILIPFFLFIAGITAEILQYFNIAQVLGFKKNSLIGVIIGSTFDIKDIVCYFLGAAVIVIILKFKKITVGHL